MSHIIQKKTYVIIAVLLFIAAVSIASTKPEESKLSIEAFATEYELPMYMENI